MVEKLVVRGGALSTRICAAAAVLSCDQKLWQGRIGDPYVAWLVVCVGLYTA